MTSYEQWSLIVTISGVFVGIAVLIVYALQLKAMRASVVAAIDAARATFIAATAAETTVKTMKDTAERQLRAYVSPNFAQRIQVAPEIFKVRVEIKNSGQTPAYDCVAFLGIGVFDLGKAPKTLTPPPDVPISQSVLASGDKLELGGFMNPLTEEQTMKISNGTQAIYVYGKVTYRDAFDFQRFTEFNMLCTGEWLAGGRFAVCPEGTKAT